MRYLVVDDSSTLQRIINTLNKLGHTETSRQHTFKRKIGALTARWSPRPPSRGRHGVLLFAHAGSQRVRRHGIGTTDMSRLAAEWGDSDPDGGIRRAPPGWRRGAARRARRGDARDAPYVGAVVLRRWRLPSMLDEPIVCRHDWRSATVAPREAAITYFANRLSHRYSFGCEPETGDLLGGAACAS